MNSKIKALFAVAIMVAAAMFVVVPMSKDDGSEAAVWDGVNTINFVGDSYTFSYKVVLPMKDAAFTATVSDDVSITNVGNLDLGSGVKGFASGTVLKITADGTGVKNGGSITLKIWYKINGTYGDQTEMTINITQVSGGTYFDETPDTTLVKGTESTIVVSPNEVPNTVSYSAVGLPAGLTMMKDGTIYGAPTTPITDFVSVDLYAYDSSNGYRASGTIKIKVIDYESLITVTLSDGSLIRQYPYVYSNQDLKFTLGNNFEFYDVENGDGKVTYKFSNDGKLGFGTSPTYTSGILDLENMRGEVTVLFNIDVDGTVVQVSKTFYVIPVSEFLTDPIADMEISSA